MPYGQRHFPFENEDWFKQNFPADFVAEGVDQCRLWFYVLHVLATALHEKPAFKNAVRKRRALVPANGFYEWSRRGGEKLAWAITSKDDALMAFAGLWETWGEDAIDTFTIVTIDTMDSGEEVTTSSIRFERTKVAAN